MNQDTKPILFDIKMVKAILTKNKTVTRRSIKDSDIINACNCASDGNKATYIAKTTGNNCPLTTLCKYKVGSYYHVCQIWTEHGNCVSYKDSFTDIEIETIKNERGDEIIDSTCSPVRIPTSDMSKGGSKITIRVTDIKIERLQDITHEDIVKEGLCQNKNASQEERELERLNYDKYWNSLTRKSQLDLFGYKANPWVWVIEFEVVAGL